MNSIEKVPRGVLGCGILLRTERLEIYAVAARCIDGTANIVVVLRAVLVDCVVIVLGVVRACQQNQWVAAVFLQPIFFTSSRGNGREKRS